MSATLWAPVEYWKADARSRADVCNGCGTEGWKGALVPDSIWGLRITDACQIHDWMYHFGVSIRCKDEADRVFLNNMVRIINEAGGFWLLRKLRLHRAHIYYRAVVKFGGPAFWAEKNDPGTVRVPA